MTILEQYYQEYVLNHTDIDNNFPELSWKECTRYLVGLFIKVALLKEWKNYNVDGKLLHDWELEDIGFRVWGRLEARDSTGEIYNYIEEQIAQGHDDYPDSTLMNYWSESFDTDSMIQDVLKCTHIANDLFIGRRSSNDMLEEYFTEEKYSPDMNWPFKRPGPLYGRRPYLQGQDPVRSNALIWVPLPILRFAFFAKEVARFGRPFEGMRAVAEEQLAALDFTQIHPEYRLILQKVLELEDTSEARSQLDILSNNLFLGEKPLTQAWVEGPEELPWIR